MHRTIRTGLILGSFVALIGAGRADAQVLEPMVFQTSFDFTVEGHSMPAGRYELRPLNDQSSVLELTSMHGRTGMFFEVDNIETRAGAAAPRSVVTFLHAGSEYALRDVWVAGENIGAETTGKLPEALRAAVTGGTAGEVRIACDSVRHARASHS